LCLGIRSGGKLQKKKDLTRKLLPEKGNNSGIFQKDSKNPADRGREAPGTKGGGLPQNPRLPLFRRKSKPLLSLKKKKNP